ncbi:MAG: hypothetical protein WAZ94_09740, partial [Phycisphaerales bacterium]
MRADRKNLRGTGGAVVAVGVAAMAWLAGCTVGPEHSVPEMKRPEHFRGAGGGMTSRPVEGGAAPGELGAWWESMADPVLTSLVERALE